MRDPAAPRFLGPRQDAIADGQRAALAALHDAQARRGLAFCLPPFGRSDQRRIIDIDDPQYCNLGHPAQLVKSARRAKVDQPFVGHILEQRLERDLLLPLEAEGLGDLPLARGLVRCGDEIHHLIARREACGADLVRCLMLLG